MSFNVDKFQMEQPGPSSLLNSSIGKLKITLLLKFHIYPVLKGGLEDFDQEVMAQVLAESQQTYLDELKTKSRKRYGSPGPSTST